MLSLGEFWLLHGFMQEDSLYHILKNIPEFSILVPVFEKESYKGLYTYVMEMPQTKVNELLMPLVLRELNRKKQNELTKDQAGWWVAKLFEGTETITDIDRGVFSIYFFNIVKANDGEAVFQGAGVPHAYLEGQTMELMANSDNVLRGGLTPKHIDTKELLKHIAFEGIEPDILKGKDVNKNEKEYVCPVPEFRISKIHLQEGETLNTSTTSLEIWFVLQGFTEFEGTNSLKAKRGEAIAILPGESFTLKAQEESKLYKAFVP
jgi:mannose-6-phosphate isomerase